MAVKTISPKQPLPRAAQQLVHDAEAAGYAVRMTVSRGLVEVHISTGKTLQGYAAWTVRNGSLTAYSSPLRFDYGMYYGLATSKACNTVKKLRSHLALDVAR